MMRSSFRPGLFALPEQPAVVVELADHQATLALGQALGQALQAGDFLGLVGTLGAGKTTFVQGLVAALDPQAHVTSPTYALLNLYETQPPLAHMDLYRLDDVDDLESMGYWDYVGAADGIVCVEWVDRIPEAWPGQGMMIELRHEEQGRQARFWISPKAPDRMREFVSNLLKA